MTDIHQLLANIVKQNPEMSLPVAAVKALTESVKNEKASTMSEFMQKLTSASNSLKNTQPRNYSIIAGCESFLKFLNNTSHDVVNLDIFKQRVLQFGENFIHNASTYRTQIANLGVQLIKDDTVILLHSYSRVVMTLLERAVQLKRRFSVVVAESRPSMNGVRAAKELRALKIPVALIPDSAIAHVMEQIDLVLVGAEGVVENGGLINQTGTFGVAVVAKAAGIPFYAVTERYAHIPLPIF
ncbi:translation initiation factor eIF-2B subunit alpha [Chytridiales sp. JEL 0842]|nr:translation initiation factor eIF-2B subunit alpha [Chytridiales sp. JEL 0842]